MRRWLSALAALSALTLTFGGSPVLAGNQSNGHSGWVVYGGGSDEVAGFEFQCGGSGYTVISGTLDSVWQRKGTLDSTGMAVTNGHAIETWAANDVVVMDGDGGIHRVIFKRRMEGTYRAGSYPEVEGPFASFSWIEHLKIQGTSDGYSLVMDLHHTTFSGTCDPLPN
jgi:hypothetical protein